MTYEKTDEEIRKSAKRYWLDVTMPGVIMRIVGETPARFMHNGTLVRYWLF